MIVIDSDDEDGQRDAHSPIDIKPDVKLEPDDGLDVHVPGGILPDNIKPDVDQINGIINHVNDQINGDDHRLEPADWLFADSDGRQRSSFVQSIQSSPVAEVSFTRQESLTAGANTSVAGDEMADTSSASSSSAKSERPSRTSVSVTQRQGFPKNATPLASTLVVTSIVSTRPSYEMINLPTQPGVSTAGKRSVVTVAAHPFSRDVEVQTDRDVNVADSLLSTEAKLSRLRKNVGELLKTILPELVYERLEFIDDIVVEMVRVNAEHGSNGDTNGGSIGK